MSAMSDCQFMAPILSDSRYVGKRLSDCEGNYCARMRENARTDYAARVRLARERAGLSQTKLAKLVGMAQSSLALAETTGVGSSYTPQIAAACKVSAEWLATGEGEMVSTSGWPGTAFTLEEIRQWPPALLQSVEKFALYELSRWETTLSSDSQDRNNMLTASPNGSVKGKLPLETKQGRTSEQRVSVQAKASASKRGH